MSEKESTYVIKIKGDIKDLKDTINEAKKSFNEIDGSGFATNLDKRMTTILGQLDKLQKKVSRPLESKAAFTGLENGFSDIVADAKSLLEELEKISKLTTKEKLSLLPEGEAKKYKDALSAISAYDRAVERAERNRIKAQEKRKSDKGDVSLQLEEAKKNNTKAQKDYEARKSKDSKYGQATAIIEQANAAKEAQKELAELEKELKKYQKRLEEINSIEESKRTDEQKKELSEIRSKTASLGGKIGARKKVINAGPDEKTLEKAKKTAESEEIKIEELRKAAVKTEKEVNRLAEAYGRLDKALKSNNTKITESQADYKILYEQAKKLGISLEGVTEDVSSENVRILQTRMRELAEQGVKPLDDAVRRLTPELEKTGNVAKEAGDNVREGLEEWSNQSENEARINQFKENIKQFIGWAGAAKLLSAALKNAFADIKELDKAMTEIATVTSFDISDMWEQLPTYTSRANELGLSITSVYEASALFYQQGLDTNEMVALSNETLKMAKIAGLDAAEATDRMTAALRGFNMELDAASAQKVADVYSELAAITASDVDEISTAMTKTASIASSAGMEFETTAAFLSQIIETTRESAETAGTAMKTVIARFQELKKAPDEIGEIDGEIVDANQIEKALRSVGVSLRDTKGEFRELDDVFLELSSKWGDLDKNTQRYIATIAAGSRQQSRFIAMMQDYERTQELVTAANNSSGASAKQYAKTLDSLETKLQQLDNAWTEFSTGLMNSDFIKTAVDFLTKLLNAINKVTEGFGAFTGSLSKIGTMIAIFQTVKVVLLKFWDNIVLETVKSARKAMKGIDAEVTEGAKKTQSNVQNITSSTNATGGASQTASMAIMSSLGISQMSEGRNNMKIADAQLSAARSGLQGAKDTQAYKKRIQPLEQEQIRIKKEKRAIKQSMKDEKDTVKLAEAQKSLNKLEKQEVEILRQKEKVNKEYTGKTINSKMSVVDAEKQVQNAQQQSVVASKEALNTMAAGAQKAGQAIALIGVGLGVVGQMFAEAGNEEAAEFFQSIGNVFTFLGSAIMGVAAMIPAFTTIFGGLVAKMVAGGISVQAAWWWVVLIVAVVAILIGLIAALVIAAKNNSPEARLERAKEAADNAAEAADRATKAYENLKEAFEGLESGYETIENLTKGTKEWNEAVKSINQSVLDLIQQYPELAQLVDNEGGVLTLDMDSDEVQQVLKDAQASAIIAQNSVTMANLNVARSEDEVEHSNLDQDQKIGHYETYGDSTVWVEEKDNTKALAKALASGAVIDTGSGYEIKNDEQAQRLGIKEGVLDRWYAQIDQSSNDLKEYGKSLLETEEQGEAAFSAVAASAMQLADTLTMTTEELNQAGSVVDDATAQAYYDEKMKELNNIDFTVDEGSNSISDDQKAMRDEAIKAQYGDAARIKGNTVTFRDANGEQKTEELTNDEIKALIANNYATKQTANAIEMAPAVIDQVISNLGYKSGSAEAQAIEAVTQDQEGGNLTQAQMDEILKMDTDTLKKAYQSLTDEQKKVFGTEQDYLDKIQGAANIAQDAFEDAESSAKKMGFELKSWMTSDLATGFTTKLEQVLETTGQAGVNKVLGAYNSLIEGKDEAIAAEITALMNGIDWTNQEALLGLQLELETRYGYTREEAEGFVDVLGEAADATSSLAHSVKVFGDLYHATQKLNAALEKTQQLQWDYERALNNGADALELSQNLEEQKLSLENEIRKAIEAYEAAQKAQVDAYARGTNVKSTLGKTAAELTTFDPTTGLYDLTELQKYIDAGEFGVEGSDTYSAVTDYVDSLEKANKTAKEQLETAKSSYESLEELNKSFNEAYADLYGQVANALSKQMEDQIQVEKDTLEATEDANSALLDKMQEQIDYDRQTRENDKQEQSLADLSQRIAYLQTDSSGANALEIAELERQLAEDTEAYQDSLIDQALNNLADANEKAAEQRDRQIALAEQQLEIYKNSDVFQTQITQYLNDYLNSYNDYLASVEEYEKWSKNKAAWDSADAATQEKYMAALEASTTGNWETYLDKYGDISAEEKVQFAAIASASQTTAQDPGGWNVAATPLGQLFETAGVTKGMNRLEEDAFWKDVDENTTKAAQSGEKTATNTGGDSGTPDTNMQTLLNLIEEHTAEAAYYDLKTQSDVALSDSRAAAASDVLGFTFRNTADKTDGVASSGANTNQYIADMAGVASSIESNKVFTDAVTEGRKNAESFKTQLQSAGFDLSGDPNLWNETAYYNNMSDSDMMTVRSEAAVGKSDSNLWWHNAIQNEFNKKAADWTSASATASFAYWPTLRKIAEGGHRDGYEGLVENAETNGLRTLRNNYMALKKVDQETANAQLNTDLLSITKNWSYGSIDSDGDDGWQSYPGKWGDKSSGDTTTTKANGKYKLDGTVYKDIEFRLAGNSSISSLEGGFLSSPEKGWMAMNNGSIYSYDSANKVWLQLKESTQGSKDLANAYRRKVREGREGFPTPAFKEGGLADFTGPAWLDGTKSRPEYILNAAQTERFFSLIDMLDTNGTNGGSLGGDNYFDIDINVESISDDYDIEQIADKIRNLIYEDATYRNVNAINHIR